MLPTMTAVFLVLVCFSFFCSHRGVLAVAADLLLPYRAVFAVAAITLSSVLLVTNFFLLWKASGNVLCCFMSPHLKLYFLDKFHAFSCLLFLFEWLPLIGWLIPLQFRSVSNQDQTIKQSLINNS
jgi:hypothetical protein